MTVNGLVNAHSKLTYRRALNDFLEWYAEHGSGLWFRRTHHSIVPYVLREMH
jgi:hypothetical protein